MLLGPGPESAPQDSADSIFWDLALGSKLLRQDSEMTLPRGSVSDLPFSLKEVLGAGLSQDCALSVTEPSQKAISETLRQTGPGPNFCRDLPKVGGGKGIPKNSSSQVFGEVRVNFFV